MKYWEHPASGVGSYWHDWPGDDCCEPPTEADTLWAYFSDAYDWANRVGPDGSRPYLYEGVFAHEYQHLLHDDFDSDEDTWLNESLSMFSEYMTGYVEGEDQYSTFQEYPENSLVVWEDQGGREIVADYGLVFLY